MLEHFICDRNLSISKGLEHALVSFTHVDVNVIKQNGKGFAPKAGNLK
jgi:hypothetical protein